MYGILSGFEIGKRGLLSQQFALNVTGHNIANVNTPGFSRQGAILEATIPYTTIKGGLGTGVDVAGVNRYRDIFFDSQYRQENQNLGHWFTLHRGLESLEGMVFVDEPSDNGLSALMDNFWNAWQELTTDPVSDTKRSTLKEQTSVSINAFHQKYEFLKNLEQSTNDDIAHQVVKVNSFTNQIANLNQQISYAELSSGRANDLRDKRDFLIDELSKIVDVDTVEQSTGAISVYVGAMALVEMDTVNYLGTEREYEEGVMKTIVVWEGISSQVRFSDGELAGLYEFRDEVIPEYINALNQMAETLVTEVNALHNAGYVLDGTTTGIDFFDPDGTTAQDIALSSDILDSASNIAAASTSGAEGNSSNASAIADLRNSLLMNNNSASIGDFYSSLIGVLGSRVQETEDIKDSQELLLHQIENKRQAVQGVSLDEEMVNMIRYQHAYEAAARVITVMDEIMATIIASVGRVR